MWVLDGKKDESGKWFLKAKWWMMYMAMKQELDKWRMKNIGDKWQYMGKGCKNHDGDKWSSMNSKEISEHKQDKTSIK